VPSREASLTNLRKAKASPRWRPPRPWRSGEETRVIKRLTWQWFAYGRPGKCSGRALARCLGVSHTWIQKLQRKFTADPSNMLRQRGEATLDQLCHAQELTRREREHGLLRSPCRWKVTESRIGDHVVRNAALVKVGTPGPGEYVPRDALVWARDHTIASPPKRRAVVFRRRRWRPPSQQR